MTDDRPNDDAADWLSAQFGSHDADEQPDETEPREPGQAEPREDQPEREQPEEEQPEREQPDVVRPDQAQPKGERARQPLPPEPVYEERPAAGGFTWGLTPPAAVSPAPDSPVTTPSVPVTPTTPADAPPDAPAESTPTATAVSTAADPPTAILPAASAHADWQPFDGSLAGSPADDSAPRTRVLPWESAGTELFTAAAAESTVAEPATELLSGFGAAPADVAAASSIDAPFDASKFHEYDASSSLPAGGPVAENAAASKGPRRRTRQAASVPRSQKTLMWIAGCLAALLVLVGLFFLGAKLPRVGAAPAPTPTMTPSPTPSATPTPAPTGRLAPGTYKWNLLRGGECLSPFDSPWAEKFTVVDCTTAHPAQMIARGTFAASPPAATDPSVPATTAASEQGSGYPGIGALQAQINLLCGTPKVINLAAAGAYRDIRFTASYPATEEQWAKGDHDYYCFVTRSSGDPLTSSVASAAK